MRSYCCAGIQKNYRKRSTLLRRGMASRCLASAFALQSAFAVSNAGNESKPASMNVSFKMSDALGINADDVKNLNNMPEQTLLHTGLLDVTKPPFSADLTGKQDSTKAIADAVFFGRHHKLAVYFPAGDYLVGDTISCVAGWSDERTPNHKYLPWVENWPCVLIGDRRGNRKPRIILAPKSPGFDKAGKPKPVFDFFARGVVRKNADGPLPAPDGSTNYQQLMYGIDVEIGTGNPGAAVATFDASEGSSIQDCTFDVHAGYTGILHGPGSGGAIFNVTINGGSIGMVLDSGRPACTITGCRFAGQRKAGLSYSQRGALTLVGCEFILSPGVPAVNIENTRGGSASLVDCSIDYTGSAPDTVAIQAKAALYLRDTWIRNAGTLLSSSAGNISAPGVDGWTHVIEAASTCDGYKKPMETPIYVDGKKEFGIVQNLRSTTEGPVNLRSRHLWNEGAFPYWDRPESINVKNAPYHARGDGSTDDTEALQRAINENEIVFLPKGAYRVTKTLKLKPKTKLFGISPSNCMLVPVAISGGDFNDPNNPKPVIQTADTVSAETILAFFSVFTPHEEGSGYSMLDVACGNMIARCILPITGYTVADIDPYRKGIYPWTNWKWEDMDSFTLQLGYLEHLRTPTEDSSFGPDNHEGGIPNWPMVRIHDNGSCRWYIFIDLDSQRQGLRHRRLLVENTKGPVRLYHAQFQHEHGVAEMEISNSENAAVYSVKNERSSTILLIQNSHNILMTGIGGPCWAAKSHKKVIINNSSNVTLSGLTPDFTGANLNLSFVHATLKGGSEIETGEFERPILFKITDESPR